MTKILLFTPMRLNPFHMRLEMIKNFLEQYGYEVKIYNLNCYNFLNKINYISLGFFNICSFLKAIPKILNKSSYNIIYLTDLQYLPIAIIGKIFRKKIIYETLDNNIELYHYNISKKYKFLKKLNFTKSLFTNLEFFLAKNFTDIIIVNSKALQEYFYPLNSELIFYASPFEDEFKVDYTKNNISFLYLGLFSKEKGAYEILDFIEKYKIKGYIFGDIYDREIKRRIDLFSKKNLVNYFKKLDSENLKNKLKEIFNDSRPIGFSLIKPVHYSYATQEANKDIDYLAMGIPIIGNYRLPTKEKIEAGCGVFFDKEEEIQKLIIDKNFYRQVSKNCKKYYYSHYSQKIFKNKLLKIISELL